MRRLVDTERLVTLLGPGGGGKTRLVGEGLPALRAPVVGVVELAACAPGEDLWSVVLDACGIRDDPALAPPDRFARRVGDVESLLVLDNCEHVRDQAAQTVVELLRACPRVRVVATSRVSLGVPGEATLAVEGLPEDDAAALFLDRARRAQPALPAGAETDRAARRIAHALDGLPLALELAAARARGLPLTAIEDGMADRLAFVSTRSAAGRDARHRSLANCLTWSTALLGERARTALAALAVVEGRCSLAAAEAVIGPSGPSGRESARWRCSRSWSTTPWSASCPTTGPTSCWRRCASTPAARFPTRSRRAPRRLVAVGRRPRRDRTPRAGARRPRRPRPPRPRRRGGPDRARAGVRGGPGRSLRRRAAGRRRRRRRRPRVLVVAAGALPRGPRRRRTAVGGPRRAGSPGRRTAAVGARVPRRLRRGPGRGARARRGAGRRAGRGRRRPRPRDDPARHGPGLRRPGRGGPRPRFRRWSSPRRPATAGPRSKPSRCSRTPTSGAGTRPRPSPAPTPPSPRSSSSGTTSSAPGTPRSAPRTRACAATSRPPSGTATPAGRWPSRSASR